MLSEEKILYGPPLSMVEACKEFSEKHSNVFEKEQRLLARQKRTYTTIHQLITEIINDNYIQERLSNITLHEFYNQ